MLEYCTVFSAPIAVRRQDGAPEANSRLHTLPWSSHPKFIWPDDEPSGDREEEDYSVKPMMSTNHGFRPELVRQSDVIV